MSILQIFDVMNNHLVASLLSKLLELLYFRWEWALVLVRVLLPSNFEIGNCALEIGKQLLFCLLNWCLILVPEEYLL